MADSKSLAEVEKEAEKPTKYVEPVNSAVTQDSPRDSDVAIKEKGLGGAGDVDEKEHPVRTKHRH